MGVQIPGVLLHPLVVKIEIRLHVVFVHDQGVGGGKHQRIFFHLVVALGDAEDGHAEVLADVELRGAHQISDVLHQQHIQAVKVEHGKHMLDRHGLDMAGAVGLELHHRDAHGVDLVRVDLSGDIAFDHADAVIFPQGLDDPGDQAGLSRAGRAHHIDHTDFFLCQRLPDLTAHILVPGQDLLYDFDLHHSASRLST